MNGPDGRFATIPIKERIAANVKVSERGCWEWTGELSAAGYSRIKIDTTKKRFAHRISYETFVGPIPEGLQIDHLCRNRACVNPEHLEAVTGRVNTLRGNTVTAANAAKDACIHGHRFTPENTYIVPRRGSRQCRACNRAIQARRRARKASA